MDCMEQKKMVVAIYVDAHMYRTPDNKYWTPTMYGYSFWKRYLDVFKKIIVISRTKESNYMEVDGYLESSGPGVKFRPLSFVVGTENKLSYIFNLRKHIFEIREALGDSDCAIFRVPSILGLLSANIYTKYKKSFALEVVADPETLLQGSIEKKLEGKILSINLKRICRKANGVSYVTKQYLQEKYKSHASLYGEDKYYFETYASSINLKKSYFGTVKSVTKKSGILLVHVANKIYGDLKGHRTALRVLKKLIEDGYQVSLRFVGDGPSKYRFVTMADELGISSNVDFLGLISSPEELRNILIESDIFIFPSKSEGLPRAVIEAMAVGLPCITSNVGGISELLCNDNMFRPNDYQGFAERVEYLIDNPSSYEIESKNNIKKAREYQEEILQERRSTFYRKLIEATIE